MKKLVLASAILSSTLITGCASIVSESTYPVAINTNPSEATFVVTNEHGVDVHSGRTPTTITLKSGDGYFSSANYTITFKKDGYADKVYVIESSLDGWYWGNILFGGLIGMLIVDPATGAMWKLPESQHITLDESPSTASSSNKSLNIMSINDIPEEDRSKLVRIN